LRGASFSSSPTLICSFSVLVTGSSVGSWLGWAVSAERLLE
jgi:hypothetical protein